MLNLIAPHTPATCGRTKTVIDSALPFIQRGPGRGPMQETITFFIFWDGVTNSNQKINVMFVFLATLNRGFLTLALAGGGRCDPPELFGDARRTMSRIVLKFYIAYRASFAQLLVIKCDRVMSGHGAMTSQELQRQAIFAGNGGLDGDIDHD